MHMHNGIMVPLDGTRFAEAALPLAMGLARRDGVALRLVTAQEPLLPLIEQTHAESPWLGVSKQQECEERWRYMANMLRTVSAASGLKVTVEYLDGRPEEVLPRFARENHLDLVVMSTRARGPFMRTWLGSVADRMVRMGNTPVLLVRPDAGRSEGAQPSRALVPAIPFRRILVPLDGSEVAEAALQKEVLAGVEGEATEVTLLHVIGLLGPTIAPAASTTPQIFRQLVGSDKAATDAYLTRMAERVARWGCSVKTRITDDPSPWGGIVNFARDHRPDVIALATRGRGEAARMLMGSTADGVVRTSPVPVLLFRPDAVGKTRKDEEVRAEQVTQLAGSEPGPPAIA